MSVLRSIDEEGEECINGSVLLYPGDIVEGKYAPDQKYYLATVELENIDGSYWLRWIEGGERALWAHPRHELRLLQGARREAPSALSGELAPGLENLDDHRAPCEDGRFYAGDVVWARWRDRRWYVAHIARELGDGTFLLDWCDNHPYERAVPAKHLRRFPYYHADDGVRFYVRNARRSDGKDEVLSESSSSESSAAVDSGEVAFASVSSQGSAAAPSSELFASASSGREEAEVLSATSAQDEDANAGSTEVSGHEEEEEEPVLADELAAERRRQRLEEPAKAKNSETEEQEEQEEQERQQEEVAEEALLSECEASNQPEQASAKEVSSKLPVSGKADPPPEMPAAPVAKLGKVEDPPLAAPRAKAGSLPEPSPEPLPEPFPEPAVGPVESSPPPTPASRASSAAEPLEDGGPRAAAGRPLRDTKAEPRRGSSHARSAQGEEAERLADLSAPPSAKPEQPSGDLPAAAGAELRQALEFLQGPGQEPSAPAGERVASEGQQAAAEGDGGVAPRQLDDAPRRTALHLIMRSEEAAATAPEEVGPEPGSPQHFAMCEDEPTTEEEIAAGRYQHVSLCDEEPSTEEEMAGRCAKLAHASSACNTPPIREEPELEEMYEFDNDAELGFGNSASSSSRSIWGNFGGPSFGWPSLALPRRRGT